MGVTGPGGGWLTLHPEFLLGVTVGMGALIGGGTASALPSSPGGGAGVARAPGGRQVEPDTRDEGELRLPERRWREMSIASGLGAGGLRPGR